MEEHDEQASRKARLALELAERLRGLREERRISLRELGRRSGVSVNTLSLMERGVTSPSVSTLYRLADALGVPITAVFGSPQRKEHVVFRPASQRTALPLPAGIWEGLGGEEFVGQVQPFMLTLEAGGDSGTAPMLHTGHEFVLCLQGRLEYEVEGRRFALGPGDSLLFAARQRHTWRNSGHAATQALILLAGFEEYDNPQGLHVPRTGM
jgi:transcriptional regulator with XRE-family HTH domain